MDDDASDQPVPGAETVERRFEEADPGPFEQFVQPTPVSPVIRRLTAGPYGFVIGAALVIVLVVVTAALV